MKTILHTEASTGWGGQEIRILREAQALHNRGYRLIFATQKGACLATEARNTGFDVVELSFERRCSLKSLAALLKLMKRERVDLVNTHSSLDAWLAGIAARICGIPVVRTRHLSATIRPGLNARILYGWLADRVVTTCVSSAHDIRELANLDKERCRSIPTGMDPSQVFTTPNKRSSFRQKFGLTDDMFVVGTLCVIRSWKGIGDLLGAAAALRAHQKLRWLVVGDGPAKEHFQRICREAKVEGRVLFTGYCSPPYDALAAMDAFVLLSTANEGVSQASLQAAYMGLPLITTRVGGLPEVCCDHRTGYTVDVGAPEQVADHVLRLMNDRRTAETLGKNARQRVLEKFSWEKTVSDMEANYKALL